MWRRSDVAERIVIAVAAWVLMAQASCYDPRLRDCSIRCGAEGECPPGMLCSGHYCASQPAGCSTAVKSGVDATPDGPVDGAIESGVASIDASHDGPPVTDGNSDGPDGSARCSPQEYWSIASAHCLPSHDLNGDGRADLLAVNQMETDALLSTGSGFTVAKWLTDEFYGYGGVFAADITGDGFSAGVAFAGAYIGVVHTSGAGFGTVANNYAEWLAYPFVGSRGMFLADVDGDRKADAVAISDDAVQVAVSTGYNFSLPVTWAVGDFTGYSAAFLADLDGDGKADIAAIGATSVDVYLSTGASFNTGTSWRGSTLSASQGVFFADVDGDGRADAVRVENDGVWVALSDGNSLDRDVQWSGQASFGTEATFLADADGDGRADVVALDSSDVRVALSTGSTFSAPAVWYSGSFAGSINTTVAPASSAACTFASQ